MPIKRCSWAGTDPLMQAYHDHEWGVPLFDDKALFEFLILEGHQAGLSWRTILNKREAYRRAFAGFDPVKVARFSKRNVERLMNNDGIIRNRSKIESAIGNARAFLDLQEREGSFAAYVWSFVDGKPQVNHWRSLKQIPAETPQSRTMSKALKRHGFSFVGPTSCYAMMQAIGMVNDHVTSCYRHAELK
jgi:DNA-3-methyladenine glycosylase I